MIESQAIDGLGALAQETRLRIVRFLVRAGQDGASAGAIGDAVGASSSRAAFHLSTLERAGLVSSRKVSRSTIYQVEFDHLGGLIGYLLHDCCNGHPQVAACCQKRC